MRAGREQTAERRVWNSSAFGGVSVVWLVLAAIIVLTIFLGVRIVPQSEKHVVERFGRLHAVLGPGINLIVPYLDKVAHRISILERQLPNASQDAITADNVLVKVETSVFYRITEPEKTVYRIRDVDGAIATTVAGIVRSRDRQDRARPGAVEPGRADRQGPRVVSPRWSTTGASR